MSFPKRDAAMSTGHAKSFLAIAIIFPVLATIFVIARFHCRYLKRVTLGLDDWLILISLIFYHLQTAVELFALFGAKIGSHVWRLNQGEALLQYKVAVFLELSYAVVITLARCSLCILFIRIFTIRSFKLAAFGNLAFNITWGIYTLFITALRCNPVQATFDARIEGKCLNETAVFVSIVGWGIACDLVTWALPLPTVWRLHLPFANRMALNAIFGLGLVVVVIGAVRIATVYTIDYSDFSYSGTTASNWAFAESGIAIMAVCGPMLRPLFDRLMPRSFIRSRDHGSGRLTPSHHARNTYGQLHDSHMVLRSGMGGISRPLTNEAQTHSTAAYSRDEMDVMKDQERSAERRTSGGDPEDKIHVKHDFTVMTERN